MLIGVGGVIGWHRSVPWLLSWYESAVSIKLPSAWALIACGTAAMMLATQHRVRRFWHDSAPVAAVFGCISILIVLLNYIEARNDAAELGPYTVVAPQMPSWGTILAVLAYGYAVIYRSLASWNGWRCTQSRWLGAAILGTGLAAVIGRLSGFPLAYWYIGGVSTGMALPTAVGIAMLGVALLILPATEGQAQRLRFQR